MPPDKGLEPLLLRESPLSLGPREEWELDREMEDALDEPFLDRPRRERLDPAEEGREWSVGGARVDEAGVGTGEGMGSDIALKRDLGDKLGIRRQPMVSVGSIGYADQ